MQCVASQGDRKLPPLFNSRLARCTQHYFKIKPVGGFGGDEPVGGVATPSQPIRVSPTAKSSKYRSPLPY
jgi:hypothetical protein